LNAGLIISAICLFGSNSKLVSFAEVAQQLLRGADIQKKFSIFNPTDAKYPRFIFLLKQYQWSSP